MKDVVGPHSLQVGQHDAGGGDGHQAGFLTECVGKHEFADHQRQHQKAAQIFRHQMPTQQRRQCHGNHNPDGGAHGNGLDKQPQGVEQGAFLAAGHHQLIGQYGKNGAQRVNYDAFPAQQPGHAAHRAYAAQQRHDHGRPGDHYESAEQQGQVKRQLQ